MSFQRVLDEGRRGLVFVGWVPRRVFQRRLHGTLIAKREPQVTGTVRGPTTNNYVVCPIFIETQRHR